MMYLLFALAAAVPPTWLAAGPSVGPSMTTEQQGEIIAQCTGGDPAAFVAWAGTSVNDANANAPTKVQAVDYCNNWSATMGGMGNTVVNPMNQLAIACGVYHCLENFFGFVAADIAAVGCILPIVLTNFNAQPSWTFPDSVGGADTTVYTADQCTCNTNLALAAPSPTFPDWLTYTGTTKLCVDKVNWDPTNAPFFGCALRACMPSGDMKEYLICTQDNYYGFEGLDQCDKLDKLVLGNLAMPVPLAIVGVVFFFLAVVTYAIVSVCCGGKKSSGGKIGV